MPSLVMAVVGLLVLVLLVQHASWSMFSAVTSPPGNSWSTGTFDCPSRSGLPTARLYYSYMPAGGTAEPDLSTGGAAAPGTLASGASRVVGNCSGNASPSVAVDGTTSGFVAANSTTTTTSPFSVSLWFKATARRGVLAGFGTSKTSTTSATADRQVYFTNAGDLSFVMQKGGGNQASCSIAGVTSGVWHSVVAVFWPGQSQMSLYLDGSGTSCVTDDNNPSSFAGYWRFGSDGAIATDASSNPSFLGSLDETAVYASALSATEVDAIYAAGH